MSKVRDNLDDISRIDSIESSVASNLDYVNTKPSGRKNLIINGGMDVWQRGTSFTGLDNGSDIFASDRWRWDERGSGTAVHTVSQSTNAPSGFPYSAKIHCTSTGSSGIYYFQQKIEGYNTYCTGWNTTTKKPITVSFWLRCTKTGKFGGAITTIDESYGYAFDVDVSNADTWERHSVTIPAPPTSPSLGTSGTGLILQFALATDVTSYRGAANTWHDNSNPLHTTDDATISIDQNGDIVYITGVQLEVGSVATPFEQRPYGEELALCQRYYQIGAARLRIYPMSTTNGWITMMQDVNFKVTMRTSPSVTYGNESSGHSTDSVTNEYVRVKRYYNSYTNERNIHTTLKADAEL